MILVVLKQFFFSPLVTFIRGDEISPMRLTHFRLIAEIAVDRQMAALSSQRSALFDCVKGDAAELENDAPIAFIIHAAMRVSKCTRSEGKRFYG